MKANKAIISDNRPNRITDEIIILVSTRSFSIKCLIRRKNSRKVKYFDNAAWLKSGIWDFVKDITQQTIKAANNKALISTMKTRIVLFFVSKKKKPKNSKTVVNSCRANRKGSNMELQKTKGSKTR